MKSNIQTLRGMKDELPLDFSKVKWIQEKIQMVLEKSGYLEYDCPVLEPIELYSKGNETSHLIENQVYSFKDKSQQIVVLRPEMTPSFARMVSKISTLSSKPIRLFSFPKCYRYERPQKGRLREFRQLNVDLVGAPGLVGDIEILYLIESIFKEFQILESVEIRYNHRAILNHLLYDQSDEDKSKILKMLDRGITDLNKLPPSIVSFLEEKDPIKILKNIESPELQIYWESLHKLLSTKSHFRFSPQTVRGIDYYTGIIFEVFPNNKNISERAILGGGRYNNLLSQFGENLPCIGLGLGLYIFQILIEEVLSQKQKIEIGYPELPYKKYFLRYLIPIFDNKNPDSIKISFYTSDLIRKEIPLSIVEVEPIFGNQIEKFLDKAFKKGYSHLITSIKEDLAQKKFIIQIKNLKTKITEEKIFSIK